MKVKCRVTTRDNWDADLRKQFGKMDSEHELTHQEIVQALIDHGRATLTEMDGLLQISFENNYD